MQLLGTRLAKGNERSGPYAKNLLQKCSLLQKLITEMVHVQKIVLHKCSLCKKLVT